MITQFVKSKIMRGFIASALVFLLFDPFTHLILASASNSLDESDYMKMTHEQLLAEYYAVKNELYNRYVQFFKRIDQVYQRHINKYNIDKYPFLIDIVDKHFAKKSVQEAIDKIRETARSEGRALEAHELRAIQGFEGRIDFLNQKINGLNQEVKKISTKRDNFEKLVWPRVKSMQEEYNQSRLPAEERLKKIEDVGKQKFGDSFLGEVRSSASPEMRQNTGRIRLPEAGTSSDTTRIRISDAQFIENLIRPWGDKFEHSPFPEKLYRVGIPEYEQIIPNEQGKNNLLLFRNPEDAAGFHRGRPTGIDNKIYELEITKLAQTDEGRACLEQMKQVLVRNPKASNFAVEIPNKEIYKASVLDLIEPRPSFMEPKPPKTPPVPPKSNLNLPESGLEGKPQKMLETANKAGYNQLVKANSELVANNQAEYLIRADELKEPLVEMFEQQKLKALEEAKALVVKEKGELITQEHAEFINKTREELEKVSKMLEHSEKAAKECVTWRKKFYNRLPIRFQKMIDRGRSMWEWFKETYDKGKERQSAGKGSLFHTGMTILFLTVAVFDIGYATYQATMEGGWAAGALTFMAASTAVAVSFVVFSVGITLLVGIGWELLAGTLVVSGAVVFLWELWERMGRLATWAQDKYYYKYILGDAPWSTADQYHDPRLAREMATQIPLYIGFRTFTGSPAFGLDKEKWYLHYPSEAQLMNAIHDYLKNLNLFFYDPKKVPPKYDYVENFQTAVRIIKGEWTEKYREDFKKMKAEFDKWRAKQLERENDLSYEIPEDEEEPEPLASILAVEMEPELPTGRHSQIKVKASYVVAALPGEKLDVKTESKLVNKDKPSQPDPIKRERSLEFAVGEAYKVGIETENIFKLSGAGDYEYTFSLNLEPEGESPEPKRIKFWIPEEEVMKEGNWYVIKYELNLYRLESTPKLRVIEVQQFWNIPKKARAGIKPQDLLDRAQKEIKRMVDKGKEAWSQLLSSEPLQRRATFFLTPAPEYPISGKASIEQHMTIPRDIPTGKQERIVGEGSKILDERED